VGREVGGRVWGTFGIALEMSLRKICNKLKKKQKNKKKEKHQFLKKKKKKVRVCVSVCLSVCLCNFAYNLGAPEIEPLKVHESKMNLYTYTNTVL
jgi:phosphate/sulfate permease